MNLKIYPMTTKKSQTSIIKRALLLFILISTQTIFSQSYKILNSATGNLATFKALTVNDDIFGYVELRKMDFIDETTELYRYNVLDKNMNPICNGEIKIKLFKKSCFTGSNFKDQYQIVYNNGHVLFTFVESYKPGINGEWRLRDLFYILNIETNTIESSGLVDKSIENEKDIEKIKEKQNCFRFSSLTSDSFLIERDLLGNSYEANFERCVYSAMNFKGEIIWQQKDYKKEKERKEYSFLKRNQDNIVLKSKHYVKGDKVSDNIKVLDAKIGDELIDVNMSNDKYTYQISDVIIQGNDIAVFGRYFEKDKLDRVNDTKSFGFYRRVIDKTTGKIKVENFIEYPKFNIPDINKYGNVRKEGSLFFKKIDVNPDGSYFILTETYRLKKGYKHEFNELFAFVFDKDFNPIKYEFYDTNSLTYKPKYTFSQFLPNNVGKAYFFYDKNEDKKSMVNIVNYNFTTKKITFEKMLIDNEESKKDIVRAKSGYIGIVEFFKETKTQDKKLEIRLEKLNYERE
jgi:hypothetical protein